MKKNGSNPISISGQRVLQRLLIAMAFLFFALLSGCSGDSEEGETPGGFNFSGPPGSLDTTFGADYDLDGSPDGFIIHANAAGGDNHDYGIDLAVDNSGRIVVAGGSYENSVNADMALWRYSSNGTLDTTFGGDVNPADGTPDGFVLYSTANSDEVGHGVAIDGSGNIVVAGYIPGAGQFDMALWRYTPDGVLDTSGFNAPTGYAIYSDAAYYDIAMDVAVDGTGKILLAGYTPGAGTFAMGLWRYNTDGTLDTAGFNSPNGFVTHDNAAGGNDYDVGEGLTIDGSDNVIVVGYSAQAPGNSDFAVWRYDSSGNLDTTGFNAPNGYLTQNGAAGGNFHDTGFAVALDGAGRIVVAGDSYNASGNRDMVIWRFNSDGTLDTTFGGDVNPPDGAPDGFVVHNGAAGGSGWDTGYGIVLDASGRIIVAGKSANASGDTDMAVWRFNTDGSLDTTFNSNGPTPGIFTHGGAAGGVGTDVGNSTTLDANGRILVSGGSTNAAGNQDMIVWRINP